MDNNHVSDSDMKIEKVFKSIDKLTSNKNYDKALEILEDNRAFISKYANVKHQLLLNKYTTNILNYIVLYSYETEKNYAKFIELFDKNRDFFEVHLDKPKYNKLLKYYSSLKYISYKKKLLQLFPILLIVLILSIYGIHNLNYKPIMSLKNFFDKNAIHEKSEEPISDNNDTSTITSNSNQVKNDSSNNITPTEDTSIIDSNQNSENIESDIEYILPSHTKELNLDDIHDMNSKDLRMAINEMYARHGYYFGQGANQRYFDEKDWYKPDKSISSPNEIVENFTEIENKNLLFLAEQEKKSKNN